MKDRMLRHLDMFWEGRPHFSVPSAASVRDAVKVFSKNLVNITWNSMSSLEHNPTSLPQTETILNGQSVSGIGIDDLLQVKHFGEGAKKLMALVSDGVFRLDEKTACALHEHVGKEESLTWGKFRDRLVTIRDIDVYTPPESDLLSGIAEKGFSFLQNAIEQPAERAIGVFLFMARNQFFHDANKRTASLMMNGVLLQNSLFPVTVMNRDSEEFHTTLRDFYNTGNATAMMGFFVDAVARLYLEKIPRQRMC
ncbi:MAG: filamentation induced by cAMP protein Fic [Candidatus Desulfovibrio kirbyi]|uniref:Filamentation induced by cAMP protein Fic n=1 Tax=Candidatus Desulfovibrio kirbyi TaxID=2696086 RepID=A0A6L2R7D8_9BACT|nr:MAG: filamentation induced by cAMP protein Fic [Candidatus Desulfovibrio kirbyi]